MKQLLSQIFNWKQHRQHLILLLTLLTMILLLASPASATGVYQMPKFDPSKPTWVLDQGEVISRLNEGRISTVLENLAKQTGNEVRLVTIHRLDYGETADSFTQALFTRWFPTPEAQANQTLLVIDTLTNTTGIRTGNKVKTIMPDNIAQSIASETVLVPLRNGNKYNQAFLDASDRLVAVLSGQPDPGPPQIVEKVNVEGTFKKAEETDTNNATIWVVGLLLAATIIPMVTYYIYVR